MTRYEQRFLEGGHEQCRRTFGPFGDSDDPDVAASEGVENVSLKTSLGNSSTVLVHGPVDSAAIAVAHTSIPILMEEVQGNAGSVANNYGLVRFFSNVGR